MLFHRTGNFMAFGVPAGQAQVSCDGTPEPLRAFLGHGLPDAAWRRIGPGVAYLPLARYGTVRMRLLRGAPGTGAGAHSPAPLRFENLIQKIAAPLFGF
jgi:hypothetical protein